MSSPVAAKSRERAVAEKAVSRTLGGIRPVTRGATEYMRVCVCICVCICMLSHFYFLFFPPATTSDNRSLCADLFFVQIYTKGYTPACPGTSFLFPREDRSDRRAQKDPTRARLASVSACLPFSPFIIFFFLYLLDIASMWFLF